METDSNFDGDVLPDSQVEHHCWGFQSTEQFDQSIPNKWIHPLMDNCVDFKGNLS
jgi:hypothetical protein